MKRTTLVSAVVFLCIWTTAAAAQKLLLNQTYLNQFPTLDRVNAETKGKDAVDTHARYMAALKVINDFLIHDLRRAPNGGYYDMPPAADRVHYRYSNELTRLGIDSPDPASRDPRFRPLRDKYENDPAFTDMLLQRLFTPQFRSEYYAWTRRPMPATTAVKAGPVVADPSIARAKAAKVDISLFAGAIRFGEPINLLSCPYQNNFLGLPMRSPNAPDCVDIMRVSGEVEAAVELINAVTNTKPAPPDPEVHTIYLSEEHRPTWIFGEQVSVRTYQGVVVRVVITTKGRSVEKRAAQELIAKYGYPNFSREATITPDAGGEFKVRNLEWILPGCHVEYQVLEHDENDRVKIDGTGYVRIELDSAYQRRTADEKKIPKRVL